MLSFKGFHIVWLKSSLKQIKNIPPNDAKKIIEKTETILINPELLDIKKLTGMSNLYRIRIGDYRVVVEVDSHNKEIAVVNLGHRKQVYNFLQHLSVLFLMNIN